LCLKNEIGFFTKSPNVTWGVTFFWQRLKIMIFTYICTLICGRRQKTEKRPFSVNCVPTYFGCWYHIYRNFFVPFTCSWLRYHLLSMLEILRSFFNFFHLLMVYLLHRNSKYYITSMVWFFDEFFVIVIITRFVFWKIFGLEK